MTDEKDSERSFRRRRNASLATLIAYAREEAEALHQPALAELLARAEAVATRTVDPPSRGQRRPRNGAATPPHRSSNGEHRPT